MMPAPDVGWGVHAVSAVAPFRRLGRSGAALALAVALVACGGDDGPNVRLGEGEIPAAIPDDFPLPEGAVIGATVVDRDRGRTEMTVQAPMEPAGLARFYGIELVNLGYVIDASSGDDEQWRIEFRRGLLEGSIDMQAVEAGVSEAVVEVNDT